MNLSPLNLILAVATAAATIFLGFLPTRNLRLEFFAREALKAAFAWLVVAVSSPPEVMHFPFLFALLCGGAWWKFRRDHALAGKMWLSLASGLGISVGIMLILSLNPVFYPETILGPRDNILLLASIYLGGSCLGLAYVCLVLARTTKNQMGTPGVLHRLLNLLLILTIFHGSILLVEIFLPDSTSLGRIVGINGFLNHLPVNVLLPVRSFDEVALLLVLIMAFLALLARRAGGFHSRVLPTNFLLGFLFVGLLAEILARLLVI